jgi:DNA-binding beta-propeller fold protein YncE
MSIANPTSHLRRVLVACLTAGALLVVVPDAAQAAPGDLSYDGCFNGDGTIGCVDLPFSPMLQPVDTAVSPDGKSVYAVAFGGDAVLHYFRGPEGQLAYDGCVNNDGTQGCADLPGTPIDGASSVAVSPDGKSVYVTGGNGGTIAHFSRLAPDGQIVFHGCLGDQTAGGACGKLPAMPLSGANDVAVSRDGTSVYVAAPGSNTVSHFFRDAEGRLGYDGCVGSDPGNGCFDLPNQPLGHPNAVTVSPDGKSVYVAASASNTVVHLFRAPGGQIGYDGCISPLGEQGCAAVASLRTPGDVEVSPDNRSVYVTNESSDAVTHFTRLLPEGQIVFKGCVASRAEFGCADLPGQPLGRPRSIDLSADGSSAYVMALNSTAIARFEPSAADGTLAYAGCIASNNDNNCAVSQNPLPFLGDSLAVSPDNRSLYAAVRLFHSLARFSIEGPGNGGGNVGGGSGVGGVGGGQGRPDTLAPRITNLRAVLRRGRPTVRFRLSEAAKVRLVVERITRRRGKPVGKPTVRSARRGANSVALPRRRLAAGTYRVRAIATDGSGNRSTPKSARFGAK